MDVERLAGYVSGRGPAWYAATASGAAPTSGATADERSSPDAAAPPPTRRGVLRQLVADLAALGVIAGTGQPPDAVPPVLGDHALADQLLVLGHELAVAPVDVSAEADRLAAAARARL